MKQLASSTSTCTDADRQLETAANERLKALGSQCRVASVFTRQTDTATVHGVAFRGASIVIEQSHAFTVEELVKAAEQHSRAVIDRSKAQWTGEAGHLPITTWPSPTELLDKKIE